MQGLQAQSLVGELRSRILHEAAKTNQQQQQKKMCYFNWRLITLQYCVGFAIISLQLK